MKTIDTTGKAVERTSRRIVLRGVRFLFALVLLAGPRAALAQNVPEAQVRERVVKRQTYVREIQGEIGSIGKRSISIIYRKDTGAGDEEELLLAYDPKSVKFDHVKGFSELAPGDVVKVRFNDEYSQTNKGVESDTLKATVISFIRKGTPAPSPAAQLQDSGTLRSN